LVIEAAFCLCLAWVMVHMVPFRLAAPLLGQARPSGGVTIGDPKDVVIAQAISTALVAASRRLPWDTTCLMRTFAARMILGRRGISTITHIGLTGQLAVSPPHAWLSVAGFDVTGGAAPGDCHTIMEFHAGAKR
jgi:hypothetical protein